MPTWHCCLAMVRAGKELGESGGKTGQNTVHMVVSALFIPQRHLSPEPYTPELELPAQGFINPVEPHRAARALVLLLQHQQEPICRPGRASMKCNYHQAHPAAQSSRSGDCWALITLAEAFPTTTWGRINTPAPSNAGSQGLAPLGMAEVPPPALP